MGVEPPRLPLETLELPPELIDPAKDPAELEETLLEREVVVVPP
jgi:hypothetical protein